MIKFSCSGTPTVTGLRLVYRRTEYSFDVIPFPELLDTSISINELELHLDHQNRVVCVTGYCPFPSWRRTTFSPPDSNPGGLVVDTPQKISPGTSIGLNDSSTRWPVFFDSNGWVCLGNPGNRGQKGIEFGRGMVAVLEGEELKALWLHPEDLPVSGESRGGALLLS